MKLKSELSNLKNGQNYLTVQEHAELACRSARELEKVGDYETAYEALVAFWPDRNGQPQLNGLNDSGKAEILQRIGALAGWLGGADQTNGSQEIAKDLITKSIEIFEGLGR